VGTPSFLVGSYDGSYGVGMLQVTALLDLGIHRETARGSESEGRQACMGCVGMGKEIVDRVVGRAAEEGVAVGVFGVQGLVLELVWVLERGLLRGRLLVGQAVHRGFQLQEEMVFLQA
jgi:hypothetical protein